MKSTNKLLTIVLVVALVATIFIPSALATVAKKTMTVDYANVNLSVNGNSITPTDVNGSVVEPFIYEGTTYLPVRAVSEALGKDVSFDTTTNTVVITEHNYGITKDIPDGFRVIMTGTGSPNMETERSQASVVLQYKDKLFLVDCGYGTVTNLMKMGISPEKITNMIFTHQHNDHNADFWNFFVQGWGSPTGRRALNLAGPGVQDLYDTTYNYYETDLEYRQEFLHTSSDGVKTNVNITEFDGTKDYSIEIDGVKITAIPVHHTITAYALKFEAGGQSVVITGDFMYPKGMKESEQARMTEFLKGADIAVVDAMLFTNDTTLPAAVMEQMFKSFLIGHISAAELIKTCADAAPKKVVLTHFSGTPELSTIAPQFKDGGYNGVVYLPTTGDVIEP